MRAKQTARADAAQAPAVGSLVAAAVQVVNELIRQLQTRTTDTGEAPVAQLTRRIARLRARVRFLEDCVVFVASAVGTCATCFGKAADCPVCRGRGQPGRLPIEAAAYAELVVPLFEHQPERLQELARKYASEVAGERGQIVRPGFEYQSEPTHRTNHAGRLSNTNGDHRKLDMREEPTNGQ